MKTCFVITLLISEFLLSQAQNQDSFSEIKDMLKEIKETLEVEKEKKRVKDIIKCVICQSTCTASLYFVLLGVAN